MHFTRHYAVLTHPFFSIPGTAENGTVKDCCELVRFTHHHQQIARGAGRLNAVEGKLARRHVLLIDHVAILDNFHQGVRPCHAVNHR